MGISGILFQKIIKFLFIFWLIPIYLYCIDIEIISKNIMTNNKKDREGSNNL